MSDIIPTALECSYGGNILAGAFTDDKIRIFDFRVKQKTTAETMILEGEHTDFVK